MNSTAWKVCLACRRQPHTITVPAKLRTRLVLLLVTIAVCFGPLLAATVNARWIDRHPNGILARIHERRMERWGQYQDDGRPKPQPQPYVQPNPQPHVDPQPAPPIPAPNAAPDSPVSGTITSGNLWAILVVPSLTTQDTTLASLAYSAPIIMAMNAGGNAGHWRVYDPSTVPPQCDGVLKRAAADGYPRLVILDVSKAVDARIVGSYRVVSEAGIVTTINTIQGAK